MSSEEKFDWCEYYNFANSFSDSDNPAELRSGISRFYYSGFCTCRDFIINNKKYLNKDNKKIMESENSEVHSETVKTFFEHNDLKPYGKKIGRELSDLRKHRNKADYDSSDYNVKSNYNYVKARLNIIFSNLRKLEK